MSAKWKSNLEHRRIYEPFAFECSNLCDDILRECQTFMKDFSIFSFAREISAVLTQNAFCWPSSIFFFPFTLVLHSELRIKTKRSYFRKKRVCLKLKRKKRRRGSNL